METQTLASLATHWPVEVGDILERAGAANVEIFEFRADGLAGWVRVEIVDGSSRGAFFTTQYEALGLVFMAPEFLVPRPKGAKSLRHALPTPPSA